MLADRSRDQPLIGSPLARSLRGVVQHVELDRVRLTFDAGEEFVHAAGFLQGGIVTAMLDFGAAFAAFTRIPIGQSAASVTINVNFLRIAPPGRYRVDATIDKLGRRMIYTQATISAIESGEAIATATSPLAIIVAPGER